MSEREYIVSLNRGVNYDEFWDQIENESDADGFVPTRRVSIVNNRDGSLRSCHYDLSETEADSLRNDSRVYSVEIPPDQRDDIDLERTATQTGDFTKTTSDSGDFVNWGLRRSIFESLPTFGSGDDYTYNLDGSGVDVVIQDSGIQADHPEFYMPNTTEYASGALVNDATNGAVFDRSLTVRGVKLVAAGAVGGATTVPDEWVKKTAQAVKLLIDPNRDSIDITQQKNLIATLKGDAGTTHAGTPTAQRIGYGGGASYTPNWLLDAGIPSYTGYQAFLDSHLVNDMVWYKNTSGPDPSTSDRDIEEIMEHLFHTIHNFGIPGAVEGSATQVPMETLISILDNNPSFSWTTTELHLAMKEAIDAGLYDPSGYATDWATDSDAAVVAYKEYTYLVNWSMWDMSEFWDGESLSPEWDDTLKTPSGMLANNPLGYAMFNKYFSPVLSKPDFNILKRIFQDNDAGVSGYVAQPSASRVQEIDWFADSGIVGETQDENFYTDYDGHGTHCAGISVGKTFGWAKNARIYAVKVAGLQGSNDPNSGIPVSDCFDVIKLWHRNKPVDSATGVKRPTIINMSWGYGSYFTNITGGNYRGTAWTGTSRDTAKGMVGSFTLSGYRYVTRVSSVDVDIQELIDEGIHVCVAAGNSYQKVDVVGGNDYNNYFTSSSFGTRYYHRGGSPYDDQALIVGNIDSSVHSGGLEQKSSSSENGPGVDIYAPGTNIMSTCSTTTRFTSGNYPANTAYKITNISGTSMASPQVCGVGALILQVNPQATPDQLKNYLTGRSTSSVIYSTGLDNDYADSRSIKGGNNRYLYNPLNSSTQLRITS